MRRRVLIALPLLIGRVRLSGRREPHKQLALVFDRAGWKPTRVPLRVPDHVHLIFLPPYSPELQPAEHLWPLTNACLINRHFASIEEREDAPFALRRLTTTPAPDSLHHAVPWVAQMHPQTPRTQAKVV